MLTFTKTKELHWGGIQMYPIMLSPRWISFCRWLVPVEVKLKPFPHQGFLQHPMGLKWEKSMQAISTKRVRWKSAVIWSWTELKPVWIMGRQTENYMKTFVQRFLDKIIDQVEDRILGLTEQGIQIYHWHLLNSFVDDMFTHCGGNYWLNQILLSYRTCDSWCGPHRLFRWVWL